MGIHCVEEHLYQTAGPISQCISFHGFRGLLCHLSDQNAHSGSAKMISGLALSNCFWSRATVRHQIAIRIRTVYKMEAVLRCW